MTEGNVLDSSTLAQEAAVLHELACNQDGYGGASTDDEEEVCDACDVSDDPEPSLAMNHLRALVHTLGLQLLPQVSLSRLPEHVVCVAELISLMEANMQLYPEWDAVESKRGFQVRSSDESGPWALVLQDLESKVVAFAMWCIVELTPWEKQLMPQGTLVPLSHYRTHRLHYIVWHLYMRSPPKCSLPTPPMLPTDYLILIGCLPSPGDNLPARAASLS
jgi:hypothetical protein